MANHSSALKRIRQNSKRAAHNKERISRIRTFIKKFTASIGSSDAEQTFSVAQSEIQRGVSRGVLHKNTASRKVSRLHQMLKTSRAK